MTLQRRRLGTTVELFGLHDVPNYRGDIERVVDMTTPVATVRAWVIADPDRYQDMVLNGKQEIVMMEMGVADHPVFHTRAVTAGSRVKWDGYTWDVVHPPTQRRGANRHVRHWRLSLRRRPLGEL